MRRTTRRGHKMVSYEMLAEAVHSLKNIFYVSRKYFHAVPGADAGQVWLGAPDAPADNARQEPAVVLLGVDHQWTPGVALDM